MIRLVFVAWLALCGVADAQLSGGLQFPGPGLPVAGGGGGCAEATAYLARKSGTTNNSDLTTYICGLVTDGVWAKLDALYVFGQDTQANSLLSLVSATFNGSGAGGFVPTWAAGSAGAGGFSSGTGDNIETSFNPNTVSSPKFTQNSASIFVWVNTTNNNAIAGTPSGGTAYIYPSSGGTAFYAVNTGAFSCTGTGGTGFHVVTRTGSTTTTGYLNGSVNTSGCTTTSATVPNVTLRFGVGDSGAGNTGQYIIGGIGGGLTGTDVSNLYNRTHTLLQAIAGYP